MILFSSLLTLIPVVVHLHVWTDVKPPHVSSMLSSDLPYPLLSNPDGINITEEVDIVVILLYMIYIMSVSCQSLVQRRCVVLHQS